MSKKSPVSHASLARIVLRPLETDKTISSVALQDRTKSVMTNTERTAPKKINPNSRSFQAKTHRKVLEVVKAKDVVMVVKPKDILMASNDLSSNTKTDLIVREVKAGETSHQESPENHTRTVSRDLIEATITKPDTVKTTELPVVSPVLKEITEAATVATVAAVATVATAVEATVVTEVETTRDSEEATEEATVATAVATMAVKVVTRTLAPEVAVATEAEATVTTTTTTAHKMKRELSMNYLLL